MERIETLEQLAERYGAPMERAVTKEQPALTPLYRRWIRACRFCVLTTVGPEGTDASPRGDIAPVVRIVDDGTLYLPDWRGNNRTDSLRNIVRDGRVSLLFMVGGCNNVVRVNGRAELIVESSLCASFEQSGQHPRSVIAISIEAVYFQCAKALMRSALWSRAPEALPSAGDFLKEVDTAFDAREYDDTYDEYAAPRMW
ncbi:MAG: pyridoxamine 5'-phosphate oxidase family protein [Pseudomonadota bacterium]|nr:pyridoxamine 5'-phosphate oxidase family protein [Pseudomonadota bacterium]